MNRFIAASNATFDGASAVKALSSSKSLARHGAMLKVHMNATRGIVTFVELERRVLSSQSKVTILIVYLLAGLVCLQRFEPFRFGCAAVVKDVPDISRQY